MSSFWAMDNVLEGLKKLGRDLDSGDWERRYSDLLSLDEYDVGYRMVATK